MRRRLDRCSQRFAQLAQQPSMDESVVRLGTGIAGVIQYLLRYDSQF
jgi:hypothetical protein